MVVLSLLKGENDRWSAQGQRPNRSCQAHGCSLPPERPCPDHLEASFAVIHLLGRGQVDGSETRLTSNSNYLLTVGGRSANIQMNSPTNTFHGPLCNRPHKRGDHGAGEQILL
jgi:hypothetical protein